MVQPFSISHISFSQNMGHFQDAHIHHIILPDEYSKESGQLCHSVFPYHLQNICLGKN